MHEISTISRYEKKYRNIDSKKKKANYSNEKQQKMCEKLKLIDKTLLCNLYTPK